MPELPSLRRSRDETVEEILDRNNSTAIVFAGQASGDSHIPQLLKELKENNQIPKGVDNIVASVEEAAKKAFGTEVIDDIKSGNPERNNDTIHAQALSGYEGLIKAKTIQYLIDNALSEYDYKHNIKYVAGHSVAETVAMIFAGALSLEDGFEFLKVRSESMEDNKRAGRGMVAATTKQGKEKELKEAIQATNEKIYGSDDVGLVIANYNNWAHNGLRGVYIVSGNLKDMELLAEEYRSRGGLVQLSGRGLVSTEYDFHHPTGQAHPAEVVAKHANDVNFQDPLITIIDYSNQNEINSASQAQDVFLGKTKSGLLISSVNGPVYWNRSGKSVIKTLEDNNVESIIALNNVMARNSLRSSRSNVRIAGYHQHKGKDPVSDVESILGVVDLFVDPIKNQLDARRDVL